MRILHLSDLHIDKDFEEKFYSKREQFYKKITEINSEEKIDMIIITGDLINGNSDDIEGVLETAYIVLLELCNMIDLDEDYLFITMGNHEVNRKKNTVINENGLLTSLNNSENVNNFIREIDQSALDSELNYLSDFNEHFTRYFLDYCTVNNVLEKKYNFNLNDSSILIYSLNSAWRSNFSIEKTHWKEDYGNIIIGLNQFDSLTENDLESKLKVCITHYPLAYLKEFERDTIEEKIVRNFDIFLTGHSHSAFSKQQNNGFGNSSRKGTCIFVRGHQLRFDDFYLDSMKYSNGFIVIDVDSLSEETIKITTTPFIYKESVYQQELERVYSEFKNEINFNDYISKKEKIEEQKEHFNEELFFNQINKESVIFDEIFVEPTIKELSDKSKQYSIDDIVNSHDSFIVFGERESGKTTFLAAIYNFLTKNIVDNLEIVYFDYNNIDQSREFEKTLRRELHYPIKRFEHIIKEESVIVLIDNLDVKANEGFIESINNMLSENLDIRIIASSEVLYKLDHSDNSNLLKNFRLLEIDLFNDSQIKELSLRWLKSKNSEDEIQCIVDVFINYKLPSNPINLNMLLWLYNEGEDLQTINSGFLLDIFIDKLLKKHNKSNIRFNENDYSYFINVLIEIVVYMHTNNTYEIERSVIFSLISDYNKRIDNTTDSIFTVDSLINIGILKYNRKKIMFRYKCYFSYFSARALEHNIDFYNSLFEDPVLFVNLYDEIDYYTGINQKDNKIFNFYFDEILNPILDEFKSVFSDLNLESIDSYFENDFYYGKLLKEDFSKLSREKREQRKQVIKQEGTKRNNSELKRINNGIDNYHDSKTRKNSKLVYMNKVFYLGNKILKNLNYIEEYRDMKLELIKNVVELGIIISFITNKGLIKFLNEDETDIENMSELEKQEMNLILFYFQILIEEFISKHIGYKNKEEIIQEILKDKQEISNYKLMIYNMVLYKINKNDYYDNLINYIKQEDQRYLLTNLRIKFLNDYYTKDFSDMRLEKISNIIVLIEEKLSVNKKTNKSIIEQRIKKERLKKIKKAEEEKEDELSV